MKHPTIEAYYDNITAADIGKVADRLLPSRIKNRTARVLECDCPHHKSQSGTSFHVILDKQMFYCHGCRVGGDVLHMVEFVQSGQVTTNTRGPMPESHRAARDYLADFLGMRPLSGFGGYGDDIREVEERRRERDLCHAIRDAAADYYHICLLKRPEVLAWLFKNYSISLETVKELKIGYTDIEPEGLPPIEVWLRSKEFYRDQMFLTGLFHKTKRDDIFPLFRNRLFFPYWSQAHVVFGIARKTPWTPHNQFENAKYKKLLVHDPERRPWVSKSVTNSMLFNEDVLSTNTDWVVITEGITDAIALMERGIPVISPVTVRLKRDDWKRVLPKLERMKTVYICQDNEISQVGLKGALDSAHMLAEAGITCKIMSLPLGQYQQEARTALEKRFGIEPHPDGKVIDAKLDGLSEEQRNEARELIGRAKTDVNEWFNQGATTDAFLALRESAKTAVEWEITSLDWPEADEARIEVLKPILKKIAPMPQIIQDRHLVMIKDLYGMKLGGLKDLLKDARKEWRREDRKRALVKKFGEVDKNDPTSCEELIDKEIGRYHLAQMKPAYNKIAVKACDWFVENGAVFLHTSQGRPYMFWKNQLLWMDASGSQKRRYLAALFKQTGRSTCDPMGRELCEVMANTAVNDGRQQDVTTWIHTDTKNHVIHFNLNNEEGQIARISPNGVTVVQNGTNPEQVVLGGANKIKPIHFQTGISLEVVEDLTTELLSNPLACDLVDRYLITSWIGCFLLLDFSGTKPIVRFEGGEGCGKTTATKLLTTLLFGETQQKNGTVAANYTDSSKNPLVVLDNIEVKNVSKDLSDFLLCASTGVVREKRANGTDTETVMERPRSLLCMTGIESLGAGLPELTSRMFTILFWKSNNRVKSFEEEEKERIEGHVPLSPEEEGQSDQPVFLESSILQKIEEHRDEILSLIMLKTQTVLGWIQDGHLKKAMDLMKRTFRDHEKARATDFLALMYLFSLAEGGEQPAPDLEELNPVLVACVNALNETSNEAARESEPIVTALNGLFNASQRARDADESPNGRGTAVVDFQMKYGLVVEDGKVLTATGQTLFTGLTKYCKDMGLAFPYTNTTQFGQRMFHSRKLIRDAGFVVTSKVGGGRRRTYSILQEES
ncbi:ZnF-CHCC domain-containing protein [Sulfidibacter corallicola]|uniref:Zinc finger CHC2-type domain-containing protein n=1 Tax=Sulfidibacter corallicola TaxID=2818388 RepID=A0A8A4TJF8_SULCO|nr:CHC2 zinc finger domain-containing protein [Sulfidibacter corallicola]QTD49627.1 hypothetical protein J3U87_28915 [Sulfidibacter corallicola]